MTRRIIEQAAHQFPQREPIVSGAKNAAPPHQPTSDSFWDTRVGGIVIGVGSAALSLIAGTYYWRDFYFAAVFLALIFIHECGHAWANIRLRIPVLRMVFIPFMGAYVSSYDAGDPVKNAFVALMGPVFGTVGSLICIGLGLYTPDYREFWMYMAKINVAITLINLLPIQSLDGSRIFPVFQKSRQGYGRARELADRNRKLVQAGYIGLVVLLLGYFALVTVWRTGSSGSNEDAGYSLPSHTQSAAASLSS